MSAKMGSSRKKKHRQALVETHGPFCYWCGLYLEPRQQTLDHIIPRSRGGTNDRRNLVLSCEACNRSKGDRLPPAEFRYHVS